MNRRLASARHGFLEYFRNKNIEYSTGCGPGGNRTPIYRMQTDCSATKLRARKAPHCSLQDSVLFDTLQRFR